MLTKTAKALDKIMGNSSCLKPYQIQSESPEIRITSINHEISSTFFVLITLMSCGIDAIAVKTPAINPKICTFIFLDYQLNIILTLGCKNCLLFVKCKLFNKKYRKILKYGILLYVNHPVCKPFPLNF